MRSTRIQLTGLSYAFAKRFGVGYGCRIVLADRDADSLSKAHKELSDAGVDVLAVDTDVSDYASVRRLASTSFDGADFAGREAA